MYLIVYKTVYMCIITTGIYNLKFTVMHILKTMLLSMNG